MLEAMRIVVLTCAYACLPCDSELCVRAAVAVDAICSAEWEDVPRFTLNLSDCNTLLATNLCVLKLPTTLLYLDGVEVHRLAGVSTTDILETHLQEFRNQDLAALQAERARHVTLPGAIEPPNYRPIKIIG